jgi:sulfatase modifying factor 1
MSMVAVKEAKWNRPYGRSNEIEDQYKLPAVHVSYKDAFAFCAWKEMRLPSEMEWEYAARGGLGEKMYPWGDFWEVGKTNLWQGKFPEDNQLRDGHFGLSPVDAYEQQNEYGMHDMIGNVWEWTSTV